MIKTKTATNFLRHVFANSVTDIANITVAEAEDDYDKILDYLEILGNAIDDWIEKIRQEKKEKK